MRYDDIQVLPPFGRCTQVTALRGTARLCLTLDIAGPSLRRAIPDFASLIRATCFNPSWKVPHHAQRNLLAVGIEEAVIDAINGRKTPSLADARERTCFAVASEPLANEG